MKKKIIIALAALIAFGSLGFGNTISFKVGYYIPSLKSDFWDNEFANMNFTKSNFQGAVFAFSYEFFLTRELSEMRAALRHFARGLRRAGLLRSSGAKRLRADGLGA